MSHQRFDLDAEMAATRAPIDANWSARKKKVVAGACAVVALAAVSTGVWAAIGSRPPSLPKTADEAIAVLSSSKFDKMTPDRRSAYSAEAGRLFRDLSEEQRRALMADEKARAAFRNMMEEMMDDRARRFARGEELPQWGPPQGQRPQRPEGEQRPERREMTDEERAAMRDRMRDMMNARMDTQFSSGNAQSGGLRAEMFKRGGMGGGRGWGGGGGGGGGGRGG